MIILESIIKYLADLTSKKFYGTIILIYENGELKRIERNEKIVSL